MTASRPILVTGGAGFIGSHLVERLLAAGHRVVVLDDCSTGSLENLQAVSSHERLRVIQAKVSECAELPGLVAGAESIYHLAAAVGVELVVRSPLTAMQTNLRETEAVLEAATAHRVPLLLASTSEVYGKSAKPAFAEDDDLLIGPPHLGRWSYACSKLMDEFLALAHARERGCRWSSRGSSTPWGRGRPGVTAWSCRASSRRRARVGRCGSSATAGRRAASATWPTRWRRWCGCKTARRRAEKFSTSAARRKSA